MAHVAKFVLLPIKPGRKEEFMTLIEANRDHVKTEPGALTWTLHHVDGAPDSIAMYETYESEEASAEHDRSPALAPVLAALPEFLAGEPTIIPMTVDRYIED
jgi:quinol monooxygenase YgiN